MSTQITTAFSEQYLNEITQLFQQDGSRLGSAVRNESQKGKTEFFEQLGATAAVKRTARHGDTPRVDSNHQRRAVYLNDYEWSDLIDQQDRIRMIVDPQGPYLQSAKMAMDRAKDLEIIAAFNGTAYADTGSGNGSVSPVTFPGAQQIAVNYPSGANTGLTLGKLIQAKSLLARAEPPKGSKMYIVTSQQQIDDLLNNVNQIQNDQYNKVKALYEGEVNYFMGLTFIRTELLPLNVATDVRTCFAWVEQAMLLSIGQDVTTRVSERDDKSYATQVYAAMTIGSTRLMDNGVVSLLCDQSP